MIEKGLPELEEIKKAKSPYIYLWILLDRWKRERNKAFDTLSLGFPLAGSFPATEDWDQLDHAIARTLGLRHGLTEDERTYLRFLRSKLAGR